MSTPLALTELFIIGSWLVVPILMVISVIDIVRRPHSAWDAAGQNQLLWAVLVVFVAFLGPVLYFALAVPKLNSVAFAAASGSNGVPVVSH